MNVAHGAMDIDCITSSSGEQQPKFNSPNLNVDRKIVSDGKEITIEGDSSGTEDSSSDSTSSGSSGSSSGSSSSSSESSESHEKPKSLAADVENLKGGQRNGKEHPKQNVHNSVDKSNPETACPPEPDNNDTPDPKTACPPEPENNDTPDPETACPPEPENNKCVPPDDVYGECLLLERLMRAKETESLSCPGGGKVQTHSKIAFTMLQNFIIV